MSAAAPRRSLSSAYADLCQTLNDQLAARRSPGELPGGPGGSPGAQRSSTVAASPNATAQTPTHTDHAAAVALGRGARSPADTSLLRDIKRGVHLRPTVSNDRSAPTIRPT